MGISDLGLGIADRSCQTHRQIVSEPGAAEALSKLRIVFGFMNCH